MEALRKVAENAQNLNLNQIFSQTIKQPDISGFVLELNKEEQLFKEGVNSIGQKLDLIGGEYAPLTVNLKKDLGQPIDRVTLFFSGQFYDSFFIEVTESESNAYFEIGADFTKEGGVDLRDRWGDEITGLTDESIIKLVVELVNVFPELIRGKLLS